MWSVRTLRQIELLVALLLILLLFSFSCAAVHPRARSGATDPGVDDATIQATVRGELIDDPRIDAEAVDLEVRRGVVTLVGWVDSDNARKTVEDLAWSVTGVRDVDNRLQLREVSPQTR